MKSKTKYYIDESKIKDIFARAKLGSVSHIEKLDAGEFNTAYFVTANEKEYVLKIAPLSDAKTLTYEKNIMEKEVDFYALIAEKTKISIPQIFDYNDSKSIIPSPYFIMEKLKSKPLTECKLSAAERKNVHAKIGEMTAELHSITGSGYGYEQNGLHDNWYLAIKSMVNNLIEDCRQNNKKIKAGNTLLGFIEKHKDVLMKVMSIYTHFDIWDGNIFYAKTINGIELSLIDTERGYWGDSIGDFVSIEGMTSVEKKVSIASYNKVAKNPILFTREELIRYNIMRAYLGLIVHSEKFVRYQIWQSKYLINTIIAKYLIDQSFKVLKKM